MIDTRDLTGPRWSSAVVCSRRAVYEGLNYEREPFTPQTLSLFRRGRYIGEAIARDLDAQLEEQGRQKGIAELEVPWPAFGPIGIGHADYYIRDEYRIMEITSSTNPELKHHKALQAAGYAIWDAAALAATVLVIDPVTYEETPYNLELDGLYDEVERIASEVVAGVTDGVIPDRPQEAESPSAWMCQGCPFVGPCWKGWEPWPMGDLPAQAVDDLHELATLKERISKARMPKVEERVKEIQARLAGGMIPGARYRAPGIKSVHYTPVEGRRSFSLKNFEAAGHKLPPDAEDFVTEVGAYNRFTLTRAETAE